MVGELVSTISAHSRIGEKPIQDEYQGVTESFVPIWKKALRDETAFASWYLPVAFPAIPRGRNLPGAVTYRIPGAARLPPN
jgi:hypothetical protein